MQEPPPLPSQKISIDRGSGAPHERPRSGSIMRDIGRRVVQLHKITQYDQYMRCARPRNTTKTRVRRQCVMRKNKERTHISNHDKPMRNPQPRQPIIPQHVPSSECLTKFDCEENHGADSDVGDDDGPELGGAEEDGAGWEKSRAREMEISALEPERKCRCGKNTYDRSDSSYIPKKITAISLNIQQHIHEKDSPVRVALLPRHVPQQISRKRKQLLTEEHS